MTVCNTAPSCTDLPAGTYQITVSTTQAGIIGSPASEPVALQGVDINDTSTLFIQVNNYTPAAGGTVNVRVRNAPNTSGTDYVWLERNYNGLGSSNGNNVPWQGYRLRRHTQCRYSVDGAQPAD